MIYYRSAPFEEIKAAAQGQSAEAPNLATWRLTQAAWLQPYRDAVTGGDRARRFLIQKPDEDPVLWRMREESFQNINVCEIIIDEQSHFAYGEPPERCVTVAGSDPDDERNEILSRVFRRVYEENCDYTFYRSRLIPSAFEDQWAWQKIWWPNDRKTIRFSRLTRESVFPVRDPQDMDSGLLAAIEIRPVGKDFEFWVWSLNPTVWKIDGGWNIIGEEPNPLFKYGAVPLIPYGDTATDGKHQIRDALTDQIVLINMRSWELTGWRAQAFSIFVASGEMINEEEVSSLDGQKRMPVGFNRFLQFEKDGKFTAVNPNFPIEQIRNAQSDLLREALERAKVSSTAIDSSGTPEQPWSLIMRHLRPLQDRKLNVASFEASEVMALKVVSAALDATGIFPHNPDMLDFKVEFPDDILPINEMEKQKQAATDVDSNKLLLEDYVTRYILKAGATKGEAADYVALLMEQRNAMQQTVLDSFGFGAKSPGAASRVAELYPNEGAESKSSGPVGSGNAGGGGGMVGSTGGTGATPGGPGGGKTVPILG